MSKEFWDEERINSAYIDFNSDNIFNQIEVTVDAIDLSSFSQEIID